MFSRCTVIDNSVNINIYNIFFSINKIARPFNLSCDIDDLKYDFNNFNFEKLLSTSARVIGIVNWIR